MLHPPIFAFDPLSRFLKLALLAMFMSLRAATTLSNMCWGLPTSGTYSVPLSCFNQVTLWSSIQFAASLRSLRSLRSPVWLPTRFQPSSCLMLPFCDFVMLCSSASASRSALSRIRNSLRSGETRRSAILRRAPRSSTCTAVFDVHRERAGSVPCALPPLRFK